MKNFKCKICNIDITGRGRYGLCKICALTGRKLSKKHRKNISIAMKIVMSGSEVRTKISNTEKGRKATKETRLKMSRSQKITQNKQEIRAKNSKAQKISMNKPEVLQKISGTNNHGYIHGLGYLPYTKEFTQKLKQQIHKRDNYICQYCGMTQEEHFKKYERDIEVHHIDYNRFNCKENNLIALCKTDNIKANYNRDYWFAYYTYLMENKIYV